MTDKIEQTEQTEPLDPNRHDAVMYGTYDPQVTMNVGHNYPAMTTMLYKVCDGNHDKFLEAMRLVQLFLDKKDEINGQK